MDRHHADAPLRAGGRLPPDGEPAPGAACVDIEVDAGIAALAGQVNRCLARWAAERADRRGPGVRAVMSEIGPVSRLLPRFNDTDVARSVPTLLQWILIDADVARSAHTLLQRISLPGDCIRVDVVGGWITLSGSVRWDHQKQAASAAVRYAIGATGLTDRVVVVADSMEPANPARTWASA